MIRRLKQILTPSKTPRHIDVKHKHEDARVADDATKEYWTRHNVSQHREFNSEEESLAYFRWRNDQYFDYIELMPVDCGDDRVVLDYGCGPGHDLVGFSVYSRPSKLVAMEISPSSLAEAESRLKLHGGSVEFMLLDPTRRLFAHTRFIDRLHTLLGSTTPCTASQPCSH